METKETVSDELMCNLASVIPSATCLQEYLQESMHEVQKDPNTSTKPDRTKQPFGRRSYHKAKYGQKKSVGELKENIRGDVRVQHVDKTSYNELRGLLKAHQRYQVQSGKSFGSKGDEDAKLSVQNLLLAWRKLQGPQATVERLYRLLERAHQDAGLPSQALDRLCDLSSYARTIRAQAALRSFYQSEQFIATSTHAHWSMNDDAGEETYACLMEEKILTNGSVEGIHRDNTESLVPFNRLIEMILDQKSYFQSQICVLEGLPGSGKTTFCRQLVKEWTEETGNYGDCKFPLVFIIQCDMLTQTRFSVLDRISRKMLQGLHDVHMVKRLVSSESCLFVVDGYKEAGGRSELLDQCLDLCIHPKSRILLATSYSITIKANIHETRYRIHNLSDQQILKYTRHVQGKNESIFNESNIKTHPLRQFILTRTHLSLVLELKDKLTPDDATTSLELFNVVSSGIIKRSQEVLTRMSYEECSTKLSEVAFACLRKSKREYDFFPNLQFHAGMQAFKEEFAFMEQWLVSEKMREYFAAVCIVSKSRASPNASILLNMLSRLPQVCDIGRRAESSVLPFTLGLLCSEGRHDDIQVVFDKFVKPLTEHKDYPRDTKEHGGEDFDMQIADLSFSNKWGVLAWLCNALQLHVTLHGKAKAEIASINMQTSPDFASYSAEWLSKQNFDYSEDSFKMSDLIEVRHFLNICPFIDSLSIHNALRLEGAEWKNNCWNISALLLEDCDIQTTSNVLSVTEGALEDLTVLLTDVSQEDIPALVKTIDKIPSLKSLRVQCKSQRHYEILHQLAEMNVLAKLKSFGTICRSVQENEVIKSALDCAVNLKELCIIKSSENSDISRVLDVLICNTIVTSCLHLKSVELQGVSSSTFMQLWEPLSYNKEKKCQWLELRISDHQRQLEQVDIVLPRLSLVQQYLSNDTLSSNTVERLVAVLPIFFGDDVAASVGLTERQVKDVLLDKIILTRLSVMQSQLEKPESDEFIMRYQLEKLLKPLMRTDVLDWDGIIDLCSGSAWRKITRCFRGLDLEAHTASESFADCRTTLFYKTIFTIAVKKPGHINQIRDKLQTLLPKGYQTLIEKALDGDMNCEVSNGYEGGQQGNDFTMVENQQTSDTSYGQEASASHFRNDIKLLDSLLKEKDPERQDFQFLGGYNCFKVMKSYLGKCMSGKQWKPIGIAILDTPANRDLIKYRPEIEEIMYNKDGNSYFQSAPETSAAHGAIVTEIIYRYAAFVDIKVFLYDVIDTNPTGENYVIHQALLDVSENNDVDIVNLSLQSEIHSNDMRIILHQLGQTKVVIAAAGNDQNKTMESVYPAQNDMVIPVAALQCDINCLVSDVHIYCPSVDNVHFRCTSYAAAHATAFAAIALRVASIMDAEDHDRFTKDVICDSLVIQVLKGGEWDLEKFIDRLKIAPERQETRGDFHKYYVLKKIIEDGSVPVRKMIRILIAKGQKVKSGFAENTPKYIEELLWDIAKTFSYSDFERIAREIHLEAKGHRIYLAYKRLLDNVPAQSDDLEWQAFISFWQWIKRRNQSVRMTAERVYRELKELFPDMKEPQKKRLGNVFQGQNNLATLKHSESMRQLLTAIYDAKNASTDTAKETGCTHFLKYVKDDCTLLRQQISKLNAQNFIAREVK